MITTQPAKMLLLPSNLLVWNFIQLKNQIKYKEFSSDLFVGWLSVCHPLSRYVTKKNQGRERGEKQTKQNKRERETTAVFVVFTGHRSP